MKMIEEDHGCEITCNFCGEKYKFDEEEIKRARKVFRTICQIILGK